MTGIILDYLHLVSENPRPLLFLEKENLLGGDRHPHPLYSQSFLQSTSMTLIIINPLHSRVAHRSFDSYSSCFTLLNTCQRLSIPDHSRSSAYHSVMAASVGGYQPLDVSRGAHGRQFGLELLKQLSMWLLKSRDRCVSIFQESYIGVIFIFTSLSK